MSQDAWISSLSLSWWPTYISSKVDNHLYVCDLLNADSRGWRVQEITRLFGGSLADWILTTPILVHCSHDLRVWGRSCSYKILLRDLSEMCKPTMDRMIETAWIRRVPTHSRCNSNHRLLKLTAYNVPKSRTIINHLSSNNNTHNKRVNSSIQSASNPIATPH